VLAIHAINLFLYMITPKTLEATALHVAGSDQQPAAPAQDAIRYKAVKPRHSFATVVGMKEVKARLLAAGKEVVSSQKGKAQPRNGVLMTGKPGNGKTFMAEALAGELKLPFLAVSYGDVASKFINDTPENVVKVFRDAVKQAPCVLFIDEVDSLLASRNHNSSYEESARITNVLLTELVNGLFNEFKVLIKQGVEAGKTLFEEIRQRLARVIESVVKKVPAAVGQMFQGGISGFMSNLLTFLINNFLSTAKRFVTVIREGLLGLFRAFKMIFFPPKHMTGDQALQEGLKILTTVVVTAVGLLLNETVATFMATVPFLKPFADLITPVLIGIMTGLLSAFLAYQIDCLFDRYRHSLSEKFMDELLADAKRRDEFANELVTLSESSLGNIENYSKSITLYQSIGVTLGSAGLAASATLASLEKTVAETGEQVAKSFAMIEFINESQSEIEDFLKTL